MTSPAASQTVNSRILDQIEQMQRCISQMPETVFYKNSPMWMNHAKRHVELLRKYGFSTFKQTVNFHYHQWRVSLPMDPKLWHLFLRSLVKGRFSPNCVFSKYESTPSVTCQPTLHPMAMFIYRVYAAMLWDYAVGEDKLGILSRFQEPEIGTPLKIKYRGQLISQDLALSAMELNHLNSAVDLSKVKSVAEIGAGYGRFAHLFAQVFPQAKYSIFDIPPTLAVSQNYLAETMGEENVGFFEANPDMESQKRVRFFLPHQLAAFEDNHFDLMINVSSLDEMTNEQVDSYFHLIESKGCRWLYLKGHAYRKGPKANHYRGLKQFPYPSHWKLIYEKKDPVKNTFIERVLVL